MKLRPVSDLHLNFSSYELPYTDDESNTILILAGDICEVAHGKQVYKEFFKDVTDRFKLVLYVFGNHEFYDTSYLRAHAQFMRECGDLDRLVILQEDTVDVDNVRFIGSTLWTDMGNADPLVMHDAKSFMNDYNLIRMGNHQTPYHRRLTPLDTVTDNKVMKAFVMEQTIQARMDGLIPVVITHMHPSPQSVGKKYKMSSLNECYHNSMEFHNEVYDNGPDLWVCGHMHDFKDYMINKTRVLCNPRGYHSTKQDEQTKFNPSLTIEI